MTENDIFMTESARIVIDSYNQKQLIPAQCTVQNLRRDISLVMVGDIDAARVPLRVKCAEPVLVLAFRVPRTGKGGEASVPAGTMVMLPAGGNFLPKLSGRGLLLCLTASRLAAILGPDMETLPASIRALLAREPEARGPVAVPLAPEQILAGNALMNCVHTGAVRNIFFKSKVLELLALFFHSLALRGGAVPPLSPREREVVSGAREFLLAHLESPPPVRAVARHVGVSETILKRLFKDAYGLSPHAYLRTERMTAAREMLLHSGANVSEAALAVGYSNISHFISAFYRRYGVRPGELRARKNA